MSIEKTLYSKFDLPSSNQTAKAIFQQLCAFWQHFSLYKRNCDKTGKSIISVYREDCPYPVWHRDEWVKNADPPGADYSPTGPFFEQLWELFQKCPIPHNIAAGNENCEYTDDWWYSRNCYLAHSGVKCEDLAYCYRVYNLKDSQFCVFSMNSERCVDLINCSDCYATTYALNSRQCSESAFLFDCRNCSDCLFSWNLRDKKYCIFNKQLTKEEYEKERSKYDFSSRKQYEAGKKEFFEILKTKAWWKNVDLEQCENCTGDLLTRCKNCENCFMVQESEDCTNVLRGYGLKDVLNTVNCLDGELIYMSMGAQDKCYDIRFGCNLIECKNMEYSAHCMQSKNCFGCCGLVGKEYYIFNKPYSADDYKKKLEEIKIQLKKEAVYGQFFPNYFAACPYEDSLADFYWPLTEAKQRAQGFRTASPAKKTEGQYSSVTEIPDTSVTASDSITNMIFWDNDYAKPFNIRKTDLKFCQENKVPLNNQYYLHRLKDNFRMIFFSGELRNTKCSKTGEPLKTGIPTLLDSQIISEKAYLEMIR